MSGFGLTHNEALAFLRDGSLPDNFAERVSHFLEFEPCGNCDDVRCMHFVFRDWWSPDFDECDRWCCPSCSDLKEHVAEDGSVVVPGRGAA